MYRSSLFVALCAIASISSSLHAQAPLPVPPSQDCSAVLTAPAYGLYAACSPRALPCQVQWYANVTPQHAGQEVGLLCTDGLGDADFPGRRDESLVDESSGPRRRALLVSSSGQILLDSGELGMSGVWFYPVPLGGAEHRAVVLTTSDPEGVVVTSIAAWSSSTRTLRYVFAHEGPYIGLASNLVPSLTDSITITTCSRVFSWSSTREAFIDVSARRGALPSSCADLD